MSIQQSNNNQVWSNFAYNDHILLAYNGYVLFSSTDSFINDLAFDTYGPIYDWINIVGTPMDGSLYPWTIGSNSFISMPPPNAWGSGGSLSIGLDDDKLNEIHNTSISSGQVDLTLVTFGDNDEWSDGDGADCYHTDFYVIVWLDWAE